MDKNTLEASVIGQEFVNGKTIFMIKNNDEQLVYSKSAYELYHDNFSLKQFNFNDLDLILTTAVQEQTSCKPSCWQLKEYGYRLESVNLMAKKANLYLNGSEKLLTFPIQDIVFNDSIINNSRALDSARIGYYYGILESKGEISKTAGIETDQILKRGILNIRSICRDGKMMVEENGQIVLSKKPIELYKNSQVLEQFPPTQALYIGYLASINCQHKHREHKMAKLNYLAETPDLLCIPGVNDS